MTWVTGIAIRANIATNARASMLNGVTRRSTSSQRSNRAHMVATDVVPQRREAVWIQVVGKHATAALGGWQRERPHAAEHVRDHVAAGKRVHEAEMFAVETRVPVHLAVVERVHTAPFPHGHVRVLLSRKHFHVEGPPWRHDLSHLVDDRPAGRDFVQQYLPDHVLVRKQSVVQIHMDDGAHLFKRCGWHDAAWKNATKYLRERKHRHPPLPPKNQHSAVGATSER